MRAALLSLLLVLGCASEGDDAGYPVQIALAHTDAEGTLYRLVNARFDIYNQAGTSYQTIEAHPSEPTLQVTLSPGIHFVQLLGGWTLQRSDDGGVTFVDQPAILASMNPAGVRVVPDRTVSVGFSFFLRKTTGELTVTFGTQSDQRQLSGGVFQLASTGVYPAWNGYDGGRIDYQIYYRPEHQELIVEDDGSKARVVHSWSSALEFYNDALGPFSQVAPFFAGGYLTYTTRIRPDGTHQYQATYQGGRFRILFTASVNASLTVGDDGFPADAFFYADFSDFQLYEDDTLIITGKMQSVRHFLD